MKVNLIKEATYDLNENKSSKIPFETFIKLCVMDNDDNKSSITPSELPDVRIFSNIDEFRLLSKSDIEKFDNSKNVYVLSNGNFCVFLKRDEIEAKGVTLESKKDAATDTEKNQRIEATDL